MGSISKSMFHHPVHSLEYSQNLDFLTCSMEKNNSRPSYCGQKEVKTTKHDASRRRVHFAQQQQTLYFLTTRPTSKTKNPIYKQDIVPKNCIKEVNTGSWLADIKKMRCEPFCHLDYLRSSSETGFSADSMTDMFHLDEEMDNSQDAACDQLFEGEVAVFNLDFYKEVYIHYTFDDWKTTRRIVSKYSSSITTLKLDKFRFLLAVPEMKTQPTLQLAIEYRVLGRVFWDNFHGQNYQFDCRCTVLDSLEEQDLASKELSEETVALPRSIPIPNKRQLNLAISNSLVAFTAPLTATKSPWTRAQGWNVVQSRYGSHQGLTHRASSWDCAITFNNRIPLTEAR